MRIRCPHCRQHVEVPDDDPLVRIDCSGCGGRFSLVDAETASHTDGAGRTVGHFRLLEQLGLGAFGAVWKARDDELDRIVAVFRLGGAADPDRRPAQRAAPRLLKVAGGGWLEQ